MALKDLTDPKAVLKALEEYDRLGRSDFHNKYGFGPADEYIIAHNGRYYDSKAIAGAAHRFQTGVPLPNTEFSGGLRGAVPRLKALGFEVVSQRRGSFVLLWNPKEWAWDDSERQTIQALVSAGEQGTGTWSTGSRRQGIHKGDRIFLFLVGTKSRGLIASGHANGEIYLGQHWSHNRDDLAPRIAVVWDMLLDPTDVLPWETLRSVVPDFRDRYQGGGARLDGVQTMTLNAAWGDYTDDISLPPVTDDMVGPDVKRSYSYGVVKRRNHQRRFRNLLLSARAPECAVCGFDQLEILEAAHIVPDSHGGPSSLENGRLLCPNHHRAHDAGLFSFYDDQLVWAKPEFAFLAPARPAN